jgi:hypothetical protein
MPAAGEMELRPGGPSRQTFQPIFANFSQFSPTSAKFGQSLRNPH